MFDGQGAPLVDTAEGPVDHADMAMRAPKQTKSEEAVPQRASRSDRAAPSSGPISDPGMFYLQGAVGNRAVQAKLELGAVDSPLEAEADRVADEVTGNSGGSHGVSAPGDAGPLSLETSSAIAGATGGGRPLDEGIRGEMEDVMGADLSAVKIHTDSQADELSRSISAKAFTTGNDVFFKAGAYDPASDAGRHLIAHEVAHTQQQSPTVARVYDENGYNPWLSDDEEEGQLEAQSVAPNAAATNAVPLQQNTHLMVPGAEEAEPSNGAASSVADDMSSTATVAYDHDSDPNASLDQVQQLVQGSRRPSEYELGGAIDLLREAAVAGADRGRVASLAEDVIAWGKVLDSREDAKDAVLDAGVNAGRKGGLQHLQGENDYRDPLRGAQRAGDALGLHDAETAALSTYTGPSYQQINPAVQNNQGRVESSLKRRWFESKKSFRKRAAQAADEGRLHAGLMMSAFESMPIVTGITGYRGSRMSQARFDSMYQDNGAGNLSAVRPEEQRAEPWSVSRDQSVAEDFADGVTSSPKPQDTVSVFYRIKIAKAYDLTSFSEYDEQEVLCPPGSKFRTTSVERRSGPDGNPKATAHYIVTIEQVS